MVARNEVPKRLFDALDRGDVGVFLRYWSALPPSGRGFHPLGTFVWAALCELAEQKMDCEQHWASDKRFEALVAVGWQPQAFAPSQSRLRGLAPTIRRPDPIGRTFVALRARDEGASEAILR